MKKYKRTRKFDNEWSLFYKIIKQIGIDMKKSRDSIDTYTYSLYDRSLYIYDSYVLIEKTNNVSVMTILLRSLYEIKIKASKLQDNKELELSNTNVELKKEMEKFLKKIEKGTSFSSQIMWSVLKDKPYRFRTKDGNNSFKRRTIKDNADDADLGFDYEISYWLYSLFVHAHPLSLMIEQKEKYPECEIIEYLSHITTDVDLLNLNFLGTILWITTYLFEDVLSKETRTNIKKLQENNITIMEKKFSIEIKIDKNIKLGTMQIGDDILLRRKQRK